MKKKNDRQSAGSLAVIGHMESEFPTKFGIPRQSGIVPLLRGEVVLHPPYNNPDAVRGLEEFSHLWLIWQFSLAVRQKWRPTVRPPRLGGNVRMGVFATRSPFRPNPIGLSLVALEEIRHCPERGPVLLVLGGDLMDKTPILDIKPYLPYADARPNAYGGFAQHRVQQLLEVDIPPQYLQLIAPERRQVLAQVLAQDPRPPYQDDPQRVYGMEFAGMEIRFTVAQGRLSVVQIERKG